eukprot:gene2963-5817_t
MDKYHIYEEIGKGEFSQVFKGREKKKIEYVAIKRVDKGMMTKVVNEVQIIHRLESPHVLKFYDWYETRNNLWLILEYCTGADLESLIKQDGHLPETSVRSFSLDILAGLKHMHILGVLHCDIRPRNILIDEYGILKISDFKYARKIPSTLLNELPLQQRGTPLYMAPELFSPDGVHSYSSDLWALGCMIYELRRGKLPFGDINTSLQQLIDNIRQVEPVSSPILSGKDTVNSSIVISNELKDLILWLLEKIPHHRCTWDEVSCHPFWGNHSNDAPEDLPPQPAFNIMISHIQHQHQHQVDSDAEASTSITEQYNNSHNTTTTPNTNTNRRHTIPLVKGIQTESTKDKDKDKDNNHNSSNQNIVKTDNAPSNNNNRNLSSISNSSSQRHNNSNSSNNNNNNNILEKKVTNTATTVTTAVTGRAVTATAATTISSHVHNHNHGNGGDGGGGGSSMMNRQNQHQLEAEYLIVDETDLQVKPIVGNRAIETIEKTPYKSSLLAPITTAITHEAASRLSPNDLQTHITMLYKSLSKTVTQSGLAVTNANNSTSTGGGGGGSSGSSGASTTLSSIAIAAIEQMNSILAYMISIAPAPEVANFILNSNFLQLILRIIRISTTTTSSNTSTSTSNNGSSKPSSSSSATSKTTSPFSTSRILAVTLLAVMLRYTTYIQNPNPPSSTSSKNQSRDEQHILPILILVLKEIHRIEIKFRRRCVAALGEMIFYISAQDENENEIDDNEHDNYDNHHHNNSENKEKMAIPDTAISTLTKALKDDNDEIVRHYAAKTIENILAQGAIECRKKFISLEIALRLLELSQMNRNEHLQATCGMALFHLLTLVLASGSTTIDNLQLTMNGQQRSTLANKTLKMQHAPMTGARFVARILDKGVLQSIIDNIRDGPLRLQQAYINILNLIFCKPVSFLNMDNNNNTNSNKTTDTSTSDENSTDSYYTNQFFLKPYNEHNDNTSENDLENSLRSHRLFLCKSALLVPALVRLVEQGGSYCIRSKALLSIQLISRYYSPCLHILTEKRLAVSLTRLLEHPIPTTNNNGNNTDGNGNGNGDKDTSMVQFSRSGWSMLLFLRKTMLQSVYTLKTELTKLEIELTDEIHRTATSTSTSSVHSTPNRKTPSKSSSSSHIQTPTPTSASGKNTTILPSKTSQMMIDVTELLSVTNTLRPCLPLITPPSLRKYAISIDFISNLSEIFVILSRTRVTLGKVRNVELQGLEKEHDVQSAFQLVEETVLVALELVSQMDLRQMCTHNINTNTTATPNDKHHQQQQQHQHQYDMQLPLPTTPIHSMLDVLISQLLPQTISLSTYPDVNIRIIVTSSLRRLIPHILGLCITTTTTTNTNGNDSSYDLLEGYKEGLIRCIQMLLLQVPRLLVDDVPIPQYTVRLLADICVVTEFLKPLLCEQLSSPSTLLQFIELLNSSIIHTNTTHENDDNDNDNEDDDISENDVVLDLDPQIAVVLCVLMEDERCQLHLIQAGLAGPLSKTLDIAISQHAYDVSMALLDLLHVFLHTVDSIIRNGNISSNSIILLKERIQPLLSLIIPLLQLMRRNVEQDNNHNDSVHNRNNMGIVVTDDVQGSISEMSIESSCSCLLFLFEHFSEQMAIQIIMKESGSNTIPLGISLLSQLLSKTQMEIRARFRLLKIVFGLTKMITSSNSALSSKVREALNNSMIKNAVIICTKHKYNLEGNDSNSEVFVSFAKQLDTALASLK